MRTKLFFKQMIVLAIAFFSTLQVVQAQLEVIHGEFGLPDGRVIIGPPDPIPLYQLNVIKPHYNTSLSGIAAFKSEYTQSPGLRGISIYAWATSLQTGHTYGISNSIFPGCSSTGNKYGFYNITGDDGPNPGVVYALYSALQPDCGVPGTSETNYAGFFSGNVHVMGTFTQASDKRLKTNIQSFKGALDKINSLRIKTYHYKKGRQFEHLNLPSGTHYGLLAQDLEQVFPELVHKSLHPGFDPDQVIGENRDKEGKLLNTTEEVVFKAVNMQELLPVSIRAIQEQQEQIEALKSENKRLEEKMEKIKMALKTLDIETDW